MCPTLGPLPNDQLISVPTGRPLEGVVTTVDNLVYLEHGVGGDGDITGEMEEERDGQRDRVVRRHWLELAGL